MIKTNNYKLKLLWTMLCSSMLRSHRLPVAIAGSSIASFLNPSLPRVRHDSKKLERPTVVTKIERCMTSTTSKRKSMKDNDDDVKTRKREIEIERKFALRSEPHVRSMRDKLSSVGFYRKETLTFTDWYFDLRHERKSGHDWDCILSRNDCWLRYRGIRNRTHDDDDGWKGEWQLKQGRRVDHLLAHPTTTKNVSAAASSDGSDKGKKNKSSFAVYEELRGEEALRRVLFLLDKLTADGSSLSERDSGNVNDDDDDGIAFEPTFPHGDRYDLTPFARIETTRSSWIRRPRSPLSLENDNDNDDDNDGKFRELKVDLDGTDFGYMVGEVEAIVEREEEVEDAKMRIDALISYVTKLDDDGGGGGGDSSVSSVEGKLETFLKQNRKRHYEALRKAGCL